MLRTIIRTLLPNQALSRIRAWRSAGPVILPLIERYCIGQGIEIGAGKNPYCSPSNTVFLDRHTDNSDGTPNADIVADANAIPRPDASFDFLLASHVLEHVPNTIRTLNEWLRVLRPGGVLFLVLPHGDRTFDSLREKTSLEHHIADFEANVEAPDHTHIQEIERGWKPLASEEAEAEYRRLWGADPWDWDFRFRNDVVHYHVWTQDEIVRLLQHLGLKIIHVNEQPTERSDSFVVVARNPT